jgi:hypothetical protein
MATVRTSEVEAAMKPLLAKGPYSLCGNSVQLLRNGVLECETTWRMQKSIFSFPFDDSS